MGKWRRRAEAPRDGEAGGVEVTEIPPPCGGGKTRRRDGIRRNCGMRGVGSRREGRVGSVTADPRARGGQGLEADPRNGGKKTYQILVLLSFFLGVEIYKGS
jgi:hypothetical protein